MRLTHLAISNYRGIRDLSIPLSRFACLIGRNNAGKSTVLQALSLFFTGSKLTKADFFDEDEPIRIAITFSGVDEHDLGRLAPEHRERIQRIAVDGAVTFARVYGIDGKNRMRYVGKIPKDARFLDSSVSVLVKNKKGSALVAAVESQFPELKGKLNASTTITKSRELIQELADSLPDDQKELSDADLPTGIDESVKAFLPEPIYIPAVKNLSDDTKTSQATPFGRILGILLDAVEPKLGNIAELFNDLSTKFNRTVETDGSVVDNRLDEVKRIEATVQTFVRESFANVSLEIKIPPPELRALLSSAQIYVDDGVFGHIDSKGDGLRRAVVFAVLRSYVELNQPGAIDGEVPEALPMDRHILLFEEPEIYLHPAAQYTLFEALRVFAERNHVVITTHSPAFFGPNGTDNFVRLCKRFDPSVSHKPFTVASRIDLDDVKEKDRFQLVCYENNNAAFFFDAVVLVEGDSDFIVWPHLLRLLESCWPSAQASVKFIRIGGKASIRRYRDFFGRFGVRVAVITDLDILTKDFDQLDPNPELSEARSRLLQLLDGYLTSSGALSEPRGKHVKAAHESGELYALWKVARTRYQELQEGKAQMDAVVTAVDEFFAWEKQHHRLDILRSPPAEDIAKEKSTLLARLREHDVFVLEKGCLEDYYPLDVVGHDKPSKAQDFCRKVQNKESAITLSEEQVFGDGLRREFEIICSGLAAIATSATELAAAPQPHSPFFVHPSQADEVTV